MRTRLSTAYTHLFMYHAPPPASPASCPLSLYICTQRTALPARAHRSLRAFLPRCFCTLLRHRFILRRISPARLRGYQRTSTPALYTSSAHCTASPTSSTPRAASVRAGRAAGIPHRRSHTFDIDSRDNRSCWQTIPLGHTILPAERTGLPTGATYDKSRAGFILLFQTAVSFESPTTTPPLLYNATLRFSCAAALIPQTLTRHAPLREIMARTRGYAQCVWPYARATGPGGWAKLGVRAAGRDGQYYGRRSTPACDSTAYRLLIAVFAILRAYVAPL